MSRPAVGSGDPDPHRHRLRPDRRLPAPGRPLCVHPADADLRPDRQLAAVDGRPRRGDRGDGRRRHHPAGGGRSAAPGGPVDDRRDHGRAVLHRRRPGPRRVHRQLPLATDPGRLPQRHRPEPAGRATGQAVRLRGGDQRLRRRHPRAAGEPAAHPLADADPRQPLALADGAAAAALPAVARGALRRPPGQPRRGAAGPGSLRRGTAWRGTGRAAATELAADQPGGTEKPAARRHRHHGGQLLQRHAHRAQLRRPSRLQHQPQPRIRRPRPGQHRRRGLPGLRHQRRRLTHRGERHGRRQDPTGRRGRRAGDRRHPVAAEQAPWAGCRCRRSVRSCCWPAGA